MTTYKIRTEETVVTEYEIEADTLKEAIESIETGEYEGTSVGYSDHAATHYRVEGQMDWNEVE